jgi:hypothetical protein
MTPTPPTSNSKNGRLARQSENFKLYDGYLNNLFEEQIPCLILKGPSHLFKC